MNNLNRAWKKPLKRLGRIRVVDIAPTVASLLNIGPPKDAQGHSLFGARGVRRVGRRR